VRNIRRDGIETFKKQQKAAVITEDDLKDFEKDLQDLTDQFIKDIDAEAAKKERELLEI
jgi:ribosome recycling factor